VRNGNGLAARIGGNLVARVMLYYAVLLGAAALLWRYIPTGYLSSAAEIAGLPVGKGKDVVLPPATTPHALGAVLAMSGAALLSLPVAWVYVLTRAKRGYQQSVVQMLVVLPMVVSGVVALVKESLPLAFGLAGIVAAVRFRTALDDSKDAVYVFLATGVGLAAAVDLQVAAAVSIVFNAVMLLMWQTDFGRSPAPLDGGRADRRLKSAMEQMGRTGTFVARIDKEVFQDMSPDQWHAVADRAWRRARRNNPEGPDEEGRREALLRVRTRDARSLRDTLEPTLDEHLKRWRYGGIVRESEGTEVLEYIVVLKKGASPDTVLDALYAAGAPDVVGAEFG
jgi:hypothetical protein